jgi:hypothetical protein
VEPPHDRSRIPCPLSSTERKQSQPDLLPPTDRDNLVVYHGIVEKKDKVVHLVAGKLFDHSQLLGSLELPSWDFH